MAAMHRRLFLRRGLQALLIPTLCVEAGSRSAFAASPRNLPPPPPPPSGVPWSTLGVVADGISDNAAALNALPTGVDIIADAPGGGEVRFGGRWLLRSGLRIHGAGERSAVIRPVADITDRKTASITQVDIYRPIRDVVLKGLTIEKTADGKLFKLYIDNFSMTHCTVSHTWGFIFIRGSNQEIAYNTVVTGEGPDGFDGPGLRHFGNYPKVPTTGGKPANVWIHHNRIVSHDASYQIDQSDEPWGDNQADDYIFEDNVAQALAGRQVLLGGSPSNTTTNVIVRRHSGSATGIQARIRNGGPTGGGFDNILFEDCTFDASPSRDKYALQILPDNGPVRGVTFRRVTVRNPYGCALKITAGIKEPTRGIVVEDCDFGRPRTARPLPAVEMDAVSGLKMIRTSLHAGEGGILAGAWRGCSDLLFQDNVVRDVDDGEYGFDLRRVDGATLVGNTVKRRSGARGARGISFMTARDATGGTTNSTATGNDLSDVADAGADLAIKYARGQGNRVKGNPGSADYPD
jgi:hypothetical protein